MDPRLQMAVFFFLNKTSKYVPGDFSRFRRNSPMRKIAFGPDLSSALALAVAHSIRTGINAHAPNII